MANGFITPTFTPCAPQGCPQPTDGAAMSLRVRVSEQTGCPGGPQRGKVCVGLGQKFDVLVVADAVPLTNGYWVAQAWIDYEDQRLVRKGEVEAVSTRALPKQRIVARIRLSKFGSWSSR